MTANIAIPLGEDKTERPVVRAIIYVRNIPQPTMLAARILLLNLNFLWNSIYVEYR
jgi:hypothetical protein